MNNTKWKENVIIVDADYVDKVAFDLTVNFERMIGRRIPKADMARWIECVALDGGLRPQPAPLPQSSALRPQTLALSPQPLDLRPQTLDLSPQASQVVLLHKKTGMENFAPGDFAELDGKAFDGRLGEFLISCVKVEEMTTMDDLFIDAMQVLANADEVKRLVVVPDAERIYHKVRDALRHADDEKRITVLSMQPMEGGNFRQEILGYSLMAALGVRSAELTMDD